MKACNSASQWERLTSVVREAEDRPRRDTRRGMIARREWIREGRILRFTEPEAMEMLLDGIECQYWGA